MKPTILQSHTRPIKSINLSPDGTKVFSASTDRTIISWNTSTFEKEKIYMHAAAINCFVVSSCGKYLISGDNTATVSIWDIEKALILTSIEGNPSDCVKSLCLNETSEVLMIAFAARGKTGQSKIKTYDFKILIAPDESSEENKKEQNSQNGKENINNNGTTNNKEKPKIYDLTSNPNTNINSDGIRNDGLKSSEEYSNQSIYNVNNSNGSNNHNSKNNIKISNINLNNNSKKQQSFKNGVMQTDVNYNTKQLLLENIKTLSEIKCLKSKYVKAVFIQKDKYILAAKEDGSIELISSSSGEILLEKQVHSEAILDFDFSEKLRYILTASTDGYSILLNLDSLEIIYKFHPENPTRNINSCRLMLIDNPFLSKKKVDVDDLFSNNVDVGDLLEDKFLKLRKNDKLPLALFSGGQDSKLVTTTHKNEGGFEIVVHELSTGMQLLNFQSHFGPVNTLGCLLENKTLASGSEDSSVRIYNIEEYLKSIDI